MAGKIKFLQLTVVLGLFSSALGAISRVCEHETMRLSCNGKISISYANYGKLSTAYCNHGGNTNCRASSSLSVLRSSCQDRSSCAVSASNGVFGDPCGGTFKYLEVHWSCLQVVNGGWSSWGSWGSCSAGCGSGTKSRRRACNNPSPANGGAYCSGSSTSSTSCFLKYCPINGGLSGWSNWGSCTKTCGGGSKARTRTCTNPTPQYGGADCTGSRSESASCNTQACPIDGGFAAWAAWGSCTVTCGGGTQDRSRTCTNPAPQYGGADCSGDRSQRQACNTHNCPIDGAFTSWTAWDTCTVTCGGGTQDRTRTCTNPVPQYGGADCTGDRSQRQDCNTHHCPIDGAFTAWTAWDTCTVTCGGGTQDRTRTCTNPAPQYGGADCTGDRSQRQNCNTHNCPIDGGFTSWTAWDTCTVTCGGGTQDRTRTCTNPAPQYGGADCTGDRSQRQGCNTHHCPIDGAFTAWTAWDTCTVTCGGGTQDRTRTCTNPAPQYGGADCTGDRSERQDCNTQVCIIDGAWGAWANWGTCTKTCGGGTYSRSRICDNPTPANGGLPCPGDSSSFDDCNTGSCPTVAPGTYQQLCPTGWFTCKGSGATCIDQASVCDCVADCDDESDETDSYANCPAGHVEQCLLKASAGQLSLSAVVLLATLFTALFASLVFN